MLVAIDSNNKLVFANQASKRATYWCSACKSRVILKKGKIKVSHYAHVKSSDCSHFSEGETKEHLEGKQYIYEWLMSEGVNVKLEAYLPSLQQRPDLLFIHRKRHIVIEFQCSAISINALLKRTHNYIKHGYYPVWILGRKLHMKDKLTSFHKACLFSIRSSYFHLLQYDSRTQYLKVNNQFLATPFGMKINKNKLDLKNLSFLSLERFLLSETKRPYYDESSQIEQKKKELTMMRYYKNEKSRLFYYLLYQNNETIETVSSSIFHIVPHEWMIQTFSYQWKYTLLLWVKDQRKSKVITLKLIKTYVSQLIEKKELVYHPFSIETENVKIIPIIEYFSVLVRKGHLKIVKNEKWKVI